MSRSRVLSSLFLALVLTTPALAGERVLLSSARPIRTNQAGSPFLIGGDFDGDGKRDFIRNESRSHVAFHRGNGDGTFEAPVTSTVSPQARSFTAADLNADGKLDLVVYDSWSAGILALLNDGAGHFLQSARIPFSSALTAIVVNDFTGDGRADIAVADRQAMVCFPGSGNGTFGTPLSTPATGAGNAAASGDINHDGKADVIFSGWYTSAVGLGKGDGTFVVSNAPVGGATIALGDLNRDGYLDFAGTDGGNNVAHVAYGNATGFGAAQTWERAWPSDIRIADMNGDRIPDVLTLSPTRSHVGIALGAGNGSFAGPRFFVTGPGDEVFDAGDYDGDGKADVLSVAASGNVASFLHGRGDGSLAAPESFDVRHCCSSPLTTGLRLAEVTGDGKLDAITISTPTSGPAWIIVVPGQGGGRFGAPIYTKTDFTSTSYTWIVTDMNGDTRPDLLVSNGVRLEFFGGNGDGTFSPGATRSFGSAGTFKVGDFTNDGVPDLLQDGYSASLYRGTGNGTFDALISTVGVTLQNTTIADANGDGKLDLIDQSGELLGDGTGHFTRLGHTSPEYARIVGAADVNGDHKLDLLTSHGTGDLLIRDGNGDGTFGTPRQLAYSPSLANRELLPVEFADIDADGNVDLVAGTSVLLGDGAGAFSGYATFRYLFRPEAIDVADLDGNGTKTSWRCTTAPSMSCSPDWTRVSTIRRPFSSTSPTRSPQP